MCVVSFAFVVYFCSTLFLFLSLFLSLLLLDDDDNNDDSLMINNSSSLTLPLFLSCLFVIQILRNLDDFHQRIAVQSMDTDD